MLKILVIAACVVGAATSAAAESGEYTANVPLAPVSPAGAFPIHVATSDFSVDGTIRMALDGAGRVSAHATFAGRNVEFSGQFVAAGGRETLVLRSSSRPGLRLAGRLVGSAFTGGAADRGVLTSGAGRFSIDVASAVPLTAAVLVSVRGGAPRARRGSGTATHAGASVPVAAELALGARPRLAVHGGSFQLAARGAAGGSPITVASWSARGFGARAAGDAATLSVTHTPLPDVVILAVDGDPLEGSATALSQDALPFLAGVFAGRGLEVASATFSDTDGAAPDGARAGIVAKLGEIRDAYVTGRALPTRIVVLGIGHGAVRAHEAVASVPDAPIAALIDFDATSCGWAARGHDDDPVLGSPVGAYTIESVLFDAEDVVTDNVAAGLEIQSTSLCPAELSGGPADIPFDDRPNRRPDGRVDDLYRLYADADHAGIHDVFGTTLPRVARWLGDLIVPRAKR